MVNKSRLINICDKLLQLRLKNICVFQVWALKKLGMVGRHSNLFYRNILYRIAFFNTFSPIFQQIWQYFAHNNAQSLPPPPPHTHTQHIHTTTGMGGDSRVNVRDSDVLAPPQCRVGAGLVILRKYTPMEFTLIKSRAMTLSRSLQYRAFSRAVIDEKSLSSLFSVGGGSGYKWLVHKMCRVGAKT